MKTDLTRFARGINQRESILLALEKKTLASCSDWLREALLQGDDLNAARASCKHGDWLDWLKTHCPLVHYRKANRYMHLAANLTRVSNLAGADSLRQALQLCDVPVDSETDDITPTRRWPLPVEALGRLSKFTGLLSRCPISKWPGPQRDKLREDLQPVARELWPEKF
jgi:hypothetical protein